MNNLLVINRSLKVCNNFVAILGSQQLVKFKSNKSSSSSSSSSSSDEDVKTTKSVTTKKNEEALNKLNLLLQKMVTEEVVSETSKLDLAKPKNKRRLKSDETEKIQTDEEKLAKAAKDVANSFGGDPKQTESELLMKLLNPVENKPVNLTDLVKGMQVEREETKQYANRSEQVKAILNQADRRNRRQDNNKQIRSKPKITESVDLFGSQPLGIFSPQEVNNYTEGVKNETWDELHAKELKLASTHPPRNYFQQMILWTEQGKIWKFPIDNEQGMEKEQNVYFTEHIFLEKHLEGWCPTRGPIRHFMELVCVGLSKNPYLTVEAKKEHIDWYRKYFDGKKELLKEVGALQENFDNKTNQLEA